MYIYYIQYLSTSEVFELILEQNKPASPPGLIVREMQVRNDRY